MLSPLMNEYESYIITEKTSYSFRIRGKRVYYVHQVNRKEFGMLIFLICNVITSLLVFIKEQPSIVISTGALAAIPTCLLAKVLRKKLIYIESFANIFTPTETGKLMYKIADQFYVQWPQMKDIYPDSIYVGGLY